MLNIHGMPLNRHTIEYLTDESLGKPMALYGLLMLAGLIAPFFNRLPGALDRRPARPAHLGGAAGRVMVRACR